MKAKIQQVSDYSLNLHLDHVDVTDTIRLQFAIIAFVITFVALDEGVLIINIYFLIVLIVVDTLLIKVDIFLPIFLLNVNVVVIEATIST